MDKKLLRQQMIAQLKELNREEKEDIERQLTKQFVQSTLYAKANTIAITISQGLEWSTKEIIETGWSDGKQIVIPKCYPKDKTMKFFHYTDEEQLEVVYYNLLEPNPEKTEEIFVKEIDLVLVPGLVFNRKGYRIGFGGGYYDRFLLNYSNETASLVSEIQLVNELPIESHDIAVQYLISETGYYHQSQFCKIIP